MLHPLIGPTTLTTPDVQPESPCPSPDEETLSENQTPEVHSMLLPTTTRSTTSTESPPAAATPETQDQLERIASTIQQLVNEQRQIRLQLGQSLVTVHKQQQTGFQEIRQRLENLEQTRHLQEPFVADPPLRDCRPALFTPAPTIPKFRNKEMQHPVKFLEELEKYLKKMKVPPHSQLEMVIEALVGEAQDWASIFQVTWATFADFRRDFLQSFWSEQEQIQLRRRITNHRWQAGHGTMEAHFTHYLGQARLLTTLIPDDLLVAELIKHFPANIQSLWILHPVKTIAAAAEFLRQQDNILASQTAPANFLPSGPKRFRIDRRYSTVPPLMLTQPSGNASRSDR